MEVWGILPLPVPSPNSLSVSVFLFVSFSSLPPSLPPALSESVLLCSPIIHFVVQAALKLPAGVTGMSSHKACDYYLRSLFPALPGRGQVAQALVLCLLGRSAAHRSSSLGYTVPLELLSSPGVLVSPVPAQRSLLPHFQAGQKVLGIWAVAGNCCYNKPRHTDLGPE